MNPNNNRRSQRLVGEREDGDKEVVSRPTTKNVDAAISDDASQTANNNQSLDDKSIVKRAYALIDRTAWRTSVAFQGTSTERGHADPELGTGLEDELVTMVAPVVARARAKDASAYFTGSESKTGGQRASLEPGAEYVRSRAPGLNSAFYLRLIRWDNSRQIQQDAQATSEQAGVHEDIPAMTAPCSFYANATVKEEFIGTHCFELKRQRKFHLVCTVVALCIFAGAGFGVAFGIHRTSQGKNQQEAGTSGPTRFGPLALSCNALNGQVQPNVLSQCDCTGNINTVATDIAARYSNLTTTFIHSVFPDFNESLNSCSPQNQALVWLASGDGATVETRMRQRYTLALLFILWKGPRWQAKRMWLSSVDECTWQGLACNKKGEVTSISLDNNNVVVDLPPLSALLTSLELLNVNRNSFVGNTIPSEIGKLTSLKNLKLKWAGINGTLPMELFNLGSTLLYFDASFNSFFGTIPTEIGKLARIEHFIFNEVNFLSGTLPTELGRCTNLEELFIDERINGTIPSEIGLLLNLGDLGLEGNDLSGTIPTELGRCSNLSALRLSDNRLNGTVPTELTKLPLLEFLRVTERNQLHVPESVCQLFQANPTSCDGCDCRSPVR